MAALPATGCGDQPHAGPGTGRRTATAPAAPAPPTPSGKLLHFRASDGIRLSGTFVPGGGRRAPAVVLVHQYQGSPAQWDEFVPILHRAGYATFAYRSRDDPSAALDETVLTHDTSGAIAALRRRRDVDPRRIAVVGASVGGDVAAWTIGAYPGLRLRAAVGLSAPESPTFLTPATAKRFHPRDLLLIAPKREIGDSRSIREDAGGRGVTVRQAKPAGHGVALLPDAEVQRWILGWLGPRMR